MQIRSPFSPYLSDCLSASVCALQQRFRLYSFGNSRHAGHEIKVFFFLFPPPRTPCSCSGLFLSLAQWERLLPTPLFLFGSPHQSSDCHLSFAFQPQRFVVRFTRWQMCNKTACPLATCPFPIVPMLITHDAPLPMPVLSLALSLSTFLAGKSQCQLSEPRTIVLTERRASQRGLGLLEPGLDQMSHH